MVVYVEKVFFEQTVMWYVRYEQKSRMPRIILPFAKDTQRVHYLLKTGKALWTVLH